MTNAIEQNPAPAATMKLALDYASQAKMVPGRRSFFHYRDLGVKAASAGRMRVTETRAIAGMTESTGWHYHTCEMQFVYMMAGEEILEFEDGTVAYFGPGDAFFIPGGVKHNELYVSADKFSIEVVVPGEMGTVECERPQGMPAQLQPVGLSAELIQQKLADVARSAAQSKSSGTSVSP